MSYLSHYDAYDRELGAFTPGLKGRVLMKPVLYALIVGLLIKLSLSAVITQWFPRPNPDHPAWNIAKEAALARAGLDEITGAQ